MKLAYVYAGQGSQKPGMGQDFYEAFPQVRALFDLTPMGIDIKKLCFQGEAEALSLTRNTQPCMGAFAAAVTQLLGEAGIHPQAALGLSLGEYGALHAAGVFDGKTLVELLAFRGDAMERAARGVQCGMTAVLSLEERLIQEALDEVGGKVWCCNFNCPGQIVIGGEAQAVQDAAQRCLEKGAKRCLPLKVSGPFHTPYMEPAAQALKERFDQMELKHPAIPVIFNVSGALLGEEDTVAGMLVEQVKSPVRLEQGLRKLAELGVDTVVEIGPGKTVSGFLRKTAPEIRCFAVEDVPTLEQAVNEIRASV